MGLANVKLLCLHHQTRKDQTEIDPNINIVYSKKMENMHISKKQASLKFWSPNLGNIQFQIKH
jgi:hypothetical protein